MPQTNKLVTAIEKQRLQRLLGEDCAEPPKTWPAVASPGNGFKVLSAEQMDSLALLPQHGLLQTGTFAQSLKWSAVGLSYLAPSVISIAKRVATHNSFCGVLNEP